MVNPRYRRVLHAVAAVMAVLVVAVLARTIRHDWPDAVKVWHEATIRWSWIALATGIALAGQLVFAYGWQRLLADMGIRVPFWQVTRTLLVSNLGRYLPAGKVWQMGMIGVLAAENDLPPARLATTSLFQGSLGCVVGVLLLFATGVGGFGPVAVLVPLATLGLVALLFAPLALRASPRATAFLARHLHGVESITVATMWALVWTGVMSWVMWGAALYCLALGLFPTAGASMVAYLAAWIGPFLVGLLAIVAPAGLGVRETVMQSTLVRAGMPSGMADVLILAQRVWVTLVDVLPAAVLLLARRRRPAPAPGADQG